MSQPEQKRDYYHTLIVGSSGRGKTYSLRNLNRKTTGFINAEAKALPFKPKFDNEIRVEKVHGQPEPHVQVLNAIKTFALNPAITTVVLDSFSAYADMVLAHCRATQKGFEIWNFYNAQIGLLMEFIKKTKKEVFVTAHYEVLNIEMSMEKRVKCKGKEWEGLIEKEFTCVVYADMKKEPNKKPEYYFTFSAPDTSAKMPPGIFGEGVFTIPNDVHLLDTAIKKFAEAA
jgi:hypothetical protein